MTAPYEFSDEDLTAFLDGEAGRELEAAISDALETDEALGERLASLDIPVAVIAQAFDGVLSNAPSMPDLPADTATPVAVAPEPVEAPANMNTRPRWGMGIATFATGLAAGLAVAVFTGFNTPEPAPRGWVSFVASYQALYTPATLMIDNPTPQEADIQLAAASSALGFDLSMLPQAEGLTYKRAQVLGFNGKTLIQIAYVREDGTPVALCIIPAGAESQGISMGAAEGLDVARWNTPGFGFLLIGGQDAAPLEREAETFQDWSMDVAI